MSLKKSRNRSFNPFNLSFLDIMSCGLGAVILIFLILKHGESLDPDQVKLLSFDIENTKESIEQSLDDISAKNAVISEIQKELNAKKSKIKKIDAEITSQEILKDSIIKENKDIQNINRTKDGSS